MRKLYDLAVKTREYTDNNGNNKASWENIGSVMENDKGTQFMFIKKTFNPAGVPVVGNARADSDSILVSMFEPKDNNNNRGNGGNGNRGGNYGNGNNRNNNGGGFYNNNQGNQQRQGQQRQQQRQQGRDDDYPMDFASFEERGFDFNDGPAGGGNEANVPF